MSARVGTGLDRLVEDAFAPLRGLRVGLVCNPTACDARFRHAADLLKAAPGVTLAALFGPEHGVRGDAQDMVGVASGVDRKTGVVCHSLYGDTFESLSPKREHLAGLDALVFDVQDVGARYYTFVYSMLLAMRAAKGAGLKFFVLDRPNPLGGEAADVEGPLVEPECASFVGLWPLPVRHSMTAGELARLFNAEVNVDLTVVPCAGWTRAMQWEDTGLAWLWPSPNMPTSDTARVYPGGCLVEGTNLSEGRGTTRPFEVSGAPFLDADALAEKLAAEALPGVVFRPLWFRPTFHKHAGQSCGGVFLHVTDRRAFRPYRTGLAFLRAARALGAEAFRWRTERYEFVDDKPAIDLLVGDSVTRGLLDRGAPLGEICARWPAAERDFAEARAPFLLYDVT